VNGPVEIELTGDNSFKPFDSFFGSLPFGSKVKLNGTLIYTMDRKLSKRKLQN
jgi:hypothetical protein